MDSQDLVAYIWSVWPERMAAVRPHYKPASRYNQGNHFLLEPGTADNPSMIVVGHFTEKVPAGWGKTMQSIDSTTAFHVASCLVNEWAGNRPVDLPGAAGIGIWMSDIDTPEKMRASPELRTAVVRQNNYCDSMIERARDLHRQKKYEQISQEYFLCASIRNLQGEDWQIRSPAYGGETMRCLFCKVVIAVDAPVCYNCKNIVNKALHETAIRQVGAQIDAIDLSLIPRPAEAPMPEPEPLVRAAAVPLDEEELKAQHAAAAAENTRLKTGAGKK